MKDLKSNTPRQNNGFLALFIGMAAGFVFLISLWIGYSTDMDHSSTLSIVAAFCSLLSAVLIFFNKSKKKSCNLTVHTDDRHE